MNEHLRQQIREAYRARFPRHLRDTRRLSRLASIPLRLAGGLLVSPISSAPLMCARAHSHARACPVSATRSIHSLVSYLIGPFKGNELAIAESIAFWVNQNIRYDLEMYHRKVSRSQAALNVLKSRLGVCAGISTLAVALMKHAGLSAVTIPGLSKGGIGGVENHMWCAARINGKWELYDITWGEHRADPRHVIKTRFPQYDAWQLIDPPMPFGTFCV